MINNLQALRAFAALNVLLFHCFVLANTYGFKPKLLSFLEGWGTNGVDIFFVISGFVMVFIQSRSPKTPTEFFRNRIERIVPLYWSITLLCSALFLALPHAFREASFDGRHALASLFFVSRFAGFRYPVLVQGWTVEYEMLFYLIFAASLLARPNVSLLLVTVALATCAAFGVVDPIVAEFVMGMVAARLHARYPASRAGPWLLAMGAAMLIASIWFPLPINRTLSWGVPAFFIVLGACQVRQMKPGLLVFLGSASYSIYLTHALVVAFVVKVGKLSGLFNGALGPDLLVLLGFVVATLVGSAVYALYEKRVTLAVRRWPQLWGVFCARRRGKRDPGA